MLLLLARMNGMMLVGGGVGGSDETRFSKCSCKCHSHIWQPAKGKANYHPHHHDQDVLLPGLAHPFIDAAHLGGREAQIFH